MAEQTADKPVIRLTFLTPRYGYWDGGKQSGGDFSPQPFNHPGQGRYIKWGSIHLNFWFTAKAGKTWKQAAHSAVMRLRALCKEPASIDIVWR